MNARTLLCLLALTAACSSNPTQITSEGLTVDQIPAEFNKMTCRVQAECAGGVFGSVDSCMATVAMLNKPNPEFDKLIAAVKAGQIKFDGVQAQACLDAMATACLSQDSSEFPACNKAFQGTLPAGTACQINSVCLSGVCELDGKGCGHCTATAKLGDACTSNEACGKSLVCANGQCAATHSVGQGGACSADRFCQAGLV